MNIAQRYEETIKRKDKLVSDLRCLAFEQTAKGNDELAKQLQEFAKQASEVTAPLSGE